MQLGQLAESEGLPNVTFIWDYGFYIDGIMTFLHNPFYDISSFHTYLWRYLHSLVPNIVIDSEDKVSVSIW